MCSTLFSAGKGEVQGCEKKSVLLFIVVETSLGLEVHMIRFCTAGHESQQVISRSVFSKQDPLGFERACDLMAFFSVVATME